MASFRRTFSNALIEGFATGAALITVGVPTLWLMRWLVPIEWIAQVVATVKTGFCGG